MCEFATLKTLQRKLTFYFFIFLGTKAPVLADEPRPQTAGKE
jgi:hypothetical protein